MVCFRKKQKKAKLDERGYSQLWNESPSTAIRTERRAILLADALKVAPGGRILEIGSGVGSKVPTVARVTGCSVTGLDLSQEFTERANNAHGSNPSVDFVCSSVADLALAAPATYDAIYGDGILHHLIYDLDRTLALLNRLLKPGGTLAFIEPNKANPYVFGIFSVERLRKLAQLEPDEMAFTKTFVFDKWTRSNLMDVEVRYRDFLLPGTPNFLVRPLTVLGTFLEKLPLLQIWSQSILISGCTKPATRTAFRSLWNK